MITSGEAHAPVLCAWSREALQAYGRREGLEEAELLDVKWSYADSPFCCFGENHFAEVRRLFAPRPPVDTEAEYDARLQAMEKAVARLDAEGLFGTGDERRHIIVNVEVMPPDETNTARAARLNPLDAEAFIEWLTEAAEGVVLDVFPEGTVELGPPIDVYVRLRPADNATLFRLRQALPELSGRPVSVVGELCNARERVFLKKCFEFNLPDIREEFADLPVDIEVQAP